MDVIIWLVILVVSLFWLVKSADYFTLWAENFGLYFGMSSFIVGATIVAIGGSMPELATSLLSALDWKTSFAVDNVIGSNIANTLLIGWIAAISVWTLTVKEKLIDVDLPFFFISSALFVWFISDGIFNYKFLLSRYDCSIHWAAISSLWSSNQPCASKLENLSSCPIIFLSGNISDNFFIKLRVLSNCFVSVPYRSYGSPTRIVPISLWSSKYCFKYFTSSTRWTISFGNAILHSWVAIHTRLSQRSIAIICIFMVLK